MKWPEKTTDNKLNTKKFDERSNKLAEIFFMVGVNLGYFAVGAR